MSIVRFLTKFLQAWRTAGQEREVLLTLLNKPGDHLLRDAGMTREDATNIVCLYRSKLLLLSQSHPIEHPSNLALWLQSERDIV